MFSDYDIIKFEISNRKKFGITTTVKFNNILLYNQCVKEKSENTSR